jgi:hypothetical protein
VLTFCASTIQTPLSTAAAAASRISETGDDVCAAATNLGIALQASHASSAWVIGVFLIASKQGKQYVEYYM